MTHWIVLWNGGAFPEQAEELDVLELRACGGSLVESHPGYLSAPHTFVLRAQPSADIFRPTGYPWVVLATDTGRAQLEQSHPQWKFKKPERLRKGSIPFYCLDPWELHTRIQAHNWDDGHQLLYQALASPTCDLGTALSIYWLGGAGWYRKYRNRNEVPSYEHDGWDLVHTVENRVLEGDFLRGWIYYDPIESDRFYASESHHFVRELPKVMFQTTGTRPPRDAPALHLAVWDGEEDKVRQLLAEGVNANEYSQYGTPLKLAIQHKRCKSLALLLAHGVEPQAYEIESAVEQRSLPLLQALSRHLDLDNTFLASAKHGWQEGATWLHDQGAELDSTNDENANALHLAAKAGHVDMVRWLIELGMDVNQPYGDEEEDEESTALADAAYENAVEVCAVLLEHGALDLDTALMWSLWCSMESDRAKVELLELLLNNGASVERALQLAATNAYESAFDLIMTRAPKMTATDSWGNQALHLASEIPSELDFRREERLRIVRKLLAAGADLTARNGDGKTPFDLAKQTSFGEACAIFASQNEV